MFNRNYKLAGLLVLTFLISCQNTNQTINTPSVNNSDSINKIDSVTTTETIKPTPKESAKAVIITENSENKSPSNQVKPVVTNTNSDFSEAYFSHKTDRIGRPKYIVISNLDGSEEKSLRRFDEVEYNFIWSPDSSKIAFVSYYDNFIYTMDTDGKLHKIAELDLDKAFDIYYPPTWSPDSKMLVFSNKGAIFTANADGTNLNKVLEMQEPLAKNGYPQITPDNRIIFSAYYQGKYSAIQSVNLDGSDLKLISPINSKNPVSTGGIKWSRSGKVFATYNPTSKAIYTFDITSGTTSVIKKVSAEAFDWTEDEKNLFFIESEKNTKIANFYLKSINIDTKQEMTLKTFVFDKLVRNSSYPDGKVLEPVKVSMNKGNVLFNTYRCWNLTKEDGFKGFCPEEDPFIPGKMYTPENRLFNLNTQLFEWTSFKPGYIHTFGLISPNSKKIIYTRDSLPKDYYSGFANQAFLDSMEGLAKNYYIL